MELNARRTFSTTASPEAAFAFLADFSNATTWDPGTVECDLVAGEVGVGAAYRNVSEFLGRRTTLTYVTLVHEPTGRLHFRGTNDSFVGDDRLSFSRAGAGTQIEYHATFDLQGASALAVPVVAAYLPFLATKTIKQLTATLDAL